ncbi:hypothetical protein GCM10023143_19110 [Compostibacter hankyongensis]|uniref:AB hydrolase-1 domain-containing protein n=2 Tax=Compostibacter hankyongensis TaxID=1007089 RepID=A0ABP8FTR7_9BACT
MDGFYLPLRENRLYCCSYGSGTRLLLALHGFAEDAAVFSCLEPCLGTDYTIVAPDLPFHGQTRWSEKYFTPADLAELASALLKRYGCREFSLLGYSMGGRLALSLAGLRMESIRELILLAPDGIKNNPWHLFVIKSRLGNQLLHKMVSHPTLFFRLLETGRKLRLLSEGFYRFIFYQMETAQKRLLVYRVWTAMKTMLPDIGQLRREIRRCGTSVWLLFGRYDRVIPPAVGEKLARGLPQCRCLVLEKGHQLLAPDVIRILGEKLNRA